MAGMQDLLDQIRILEKRVADQVSAEAAQFGYTVQRGRARFSDETRRRHREMQKRLRDYLRDASLPVIVTGPLIYSLVLPMAALDVMVTLYQWVCFPVYGIPRVIRRDYFVYDRHHLRYMNLIERFHCFYCSYANGLLGYAMEIAGRTEQHWCPVKHARKVKHPHSRYYRFFSYGDADSYRDRLEELRTRFDDLKETAAVSSESKDKGNE